MVVNAEIEEKRYQQELLDTKSVLNRLSSSLTELELKSGTEGIVLERKVEEGEVRSAGEGFFSIGEISPLHVVADVSQEDKDGTFLGQEAEVSFNFLPGKTFSGKVTRIDPGVDIETQTFKVTISIPNQDKSLSPGSAAFVRFNAKSDSIVIPRHAVIGIPNDPAVYVLDDDNTVDLRKIVLGTALPPGKIEVIEGLREGEKVVTTNIKFLKQGSLVSISDDTVFQ